MATVQTARTEFVEASNGVRYAYRRLGKPNGIPLFMHMHFRGNMDFWDPAFVDPIAAERPVFLFDQAGVGRSSGQVADTFQGWADHVIVLVKALGIKKIDILGFSMGGNAVQMVALTSPDLVRKLIIAGSGPSTPSGPTPGLLWPRDTPPPAPIQKLIAARTEEEIEHAIAFSFFDDTELGHQAGSAYSQRISTAREGSGEQPLHGLLDAERSKVQLRAGGHWSKHNPRNSFDRLGELKMPVLVVNGDNDLLIPTSRSYELVKLIRNAQLIIYPRTGHGFLWQYPGKVASDVNAFLDGKDFERSEAKL